MFDEVVKFMKIHIGKELTAEAAHGQAFAWRCVEQGFVGRDLGQQMTPTADGRRRINRVLRQNGQRNLVQPFACGLVVRQSWQSPVPELAQYGSVHTGEKSPDIELAVPAVAGLAHEMQQAFDGGLCAFALTVGKAVVDKALIPPRLNMPDQPLLHQPVVSSQ